MVNINKYNKFQQYNYIRNGSSMASDFFYPSIGGVEEHIFNLTQILLNNGHQVIILTHSYDNCKGIRYMTNGLKIYYLPIKTFYNQCILPTVICNIPLIRCVLLREEIDIVHGHSAFSALAHESMTVAKLLGIRTVFTDHSLFGFADLSAVFTNKLLEIDLSMVNHCICVSHIGKENTILRAHVAPHKVSVIPNAVDTILFTPEPSKRAENNTINIIIASRLVYRKGIDLLAGVIPRFKRMENINFIIVGNGPKRDLLEEIREKTNMHERIEIIGAVEHSKIRDILIRGHIFVNTSLTEAYCMAIVEAASCGLQVVSTRVGGIPEVLPSNLIILTEPEINAIYNGIMTAIERYKSFQKRIQRCKQSDVGISSNINYGNNDAELCPYRCNETVSTLYNWENVTQRIEMVYQRIMTDPMPSFGDILHAYQRTGVWPFLLLLSMCYLVLQILEYIRPRHLVEKAWSLPQLLKSKYK